MTAYVNQSEATTLSPVTIGALRDLGYEVNGSPAPFPNWIL